MHPAKDDDSATVRKNDKPAIEDLKQPKVSDADATSVKGGSFNPQPEPPGRR